jgi:hypothetical protein
MIRRLTVFKAVARHYRPREPASAIANPWFGHPANAAQRTGQSRYSLA